MAGGGDILPARYGEETIPACGEADAQRDAFELLIIPMAISRKMPVFGICRGIQVLNVAMGGTLIQDIESQKGIPTGAPELQIDGQTDDGMIEAVSAKNNSRIFAVQFHPEYLSDHDVYAQKLFAHFVKLACDYQSEKA